MSQVRNKRDQWVDYFLYGGESPTITTPKVKKPMKIQVIQLFSESDMERKLTDSKANLCKAYSHYKCICGYKESIEKDRKTYDSTDNRSKGE